MSAAPAKPKFMLVSNNEDFRVETACLNRFRSKSGRNDLRVALVTGGADTTLTALMHPSVAHVTSFDPSPLQIHLLRLKLAVATSDLTSEDAVGFLCSGKDGKETFNKKLVPLLPKETVEFFQTTGEDEITLGIMRADNDGPFNKMFRKWLADNHGLDMTKWRVMNEADKDKLLDICATHESTSLSNDIQAFFKKAPWFNGMPAEAQAFILSAVGTAAESTLRNTGNILSCMDQGLIPSNEYHNDILQSGGTMQTLPPWLTESGRRILRKKSSQLDTVQSKACDLKGGPFDFVSLSNIYDFSPEDAAINDLKAVVASIVKPGGEVLMRRAIGNVPAIFKEAGGTCLEGEALENFDYNSLFYQNVGTVASAKF